MATDTEKQLKHMNHLQFIVTPMVAAIIAIMGWMLMTVVELKEDISTVKTDVKYITKQIDMIESKLAIREFNETEDYAVK